jgi:lipoprotein
MKRITTFLLFILAGIILFSCHTSNDISGLYLNAPKGWASYSQLDLRKDSTFDMRFMNQGFIPSYHSTGKWHFDEKNKDVSLASYIKRAPTFPITVEESIAKAKGTTFVFRNRLKALGFFCTEEAEGGKDKWILNANGIDYEITSDTLTISQENISLFCIEGFWNKSRRDLDPDRIHKKSKVYYVEKTGSNMFMIDFPDCWDGYPFAYVSIYSSVRFHLTGKKLILRNNPKTMVYEKIKDEKLANEYRKEFCP